ncbi:MAG: M3 family metallopeptidase [Planctomycetota bacterium]|jgi:Zn-dependent oligopeptidase
MTTTTSTWVDDLNHEYESLHTAKEDAFWSVYMGLADDADAARTDFNAKEMALQRFLQDPARLTKVREELAVAKAAGADAETLTSLAGWEATFAAHAIDDAAARDLFEEILEAESALAKARAGMDLGYTPPGGEFVSASSVKLGAMLLAESDPAMRKAAWDGLRSIEPVALDNGFLQIVKMRNRLGRMLGGEDYYDWKVRRTERMSKRQVFDWLDELEAKTRDTARAAVERMATERGETVTPWNVRYWTAGDVGREQDAYFPFSKALLSWGRAFYNMHVDYQGAELVLDLVDRKGKYENGFMHGPVPAWRERGEFRRARIQFTANAIPGMVGAGRRAAETLFHEGGHAAHFANIDMPSPCFAQEFAPTSVAFAETQSMFMDSLLSDADWQARHAKSADGTPMPVELIEKGLRARQPMAAWEVRQRLSVCYGEKAIYEIPDDELTAERVVDAIRGEETRLLFLEDGSPRPILAVPHLLSGESSAYYHGYVLAEMAVHQTRNHFLARDGHLLDNERIGPELREAYWKPGNSRTFGEFVEALTGTPLSADHLATEANRSADEAVASAREAIARSADVPSCEMPIELNASIRVMHGQQTVASNDGKSFEECAADFERWIDAQAAG